MKAKIFQNGFTSWQEAHFEIVSAIATELNKDKLDSKVIEKRHQEQGTGGMYEFAEELTNEFELKYKGVAWDGGFYDAMGAFINEKLYVQ